MGASALAFDAVTRLCQALIGLDAVHTTAIRERLESVASGWRAPVDAAGAVQCAVWDLVGRHLRAPLHVLFGAGRPQAVLAPGHVSLHDAGESVEAVVDRAKAMVGKHAHEALLVTIPSGVRARGALVLRDLRRVFGSGMRIRVECTGDDAIGSADSLLAAIDDLDIEYLAGVAWKLADQERLRRKYSTPLASYALPGDSLASWIRASAGEVIIGDAVGWGGVSAFRKHASVCRAFSIDIAVSGVQTLGPAIAMSLQLIATHAAAGKGFHAVPHDLGSSCVFAPGPQVRDGRIAVPEDPGIGWSIEPSRLQKRAYAETVIVSPVEVAP